MTQLTNIKNTLKTLPLIAVLAAGLTLTPLTTMAAGGDRSSHKSEHSKGYGKRQDRNYYRSDKAHKRSDSSYRRSSKGHYKTDKYRYSHAGKRYKNSVGHQLHSNYDKHRYDRHYPKYDRQYDHKGHGTTHYVINDYGHRDRYYDYDRLRLMIGLHTDNFDITFRD